MDDILFSVDNSLRGESRDSSLDAALDSLLEVVESIDVPPTTQHLFPSLDLLRTAIIKPQSGSLISKLGGRFDRKDMIDSLLAESFNFLQVENHPDMRVYLFSRLFLGREDAAAAATPSQPDYLPSAAFEALSKALDSKIETDRDLLNFVKKNLGRYPSFQRALFNILAKYVRR